MTYSLTNKLKFDENPVIEIKGNLFEVNADAETMLNIMADFDEKSGYAAALSAYNRLFSEDARKKLAELKLSTPDLLTLVETAMALAQGEDPEEVEKNEETPSIL